MREKFNLLKQKYSEVADISSATSVLHWDQQVYMPRGGGAARARAISALEELAHRKFTAPETGKLIAETYDWAQALGHDSFEASYLRAVKRDYDQAAKLPAEFVAEFSKTVSEAIGAWTQARADSNFGAFAPWLEKILELNIKKAEILGFKNSPYDALLDLYEPGIKKEHIEPLFSELAKGLKPIMKSISANAVAVSNDCLRGDFDEDAQLRLANEIVRDLGYDLERGRQDRSAHPFTIDFSINDVRITTRTIKNQFTAAIYGSIHECGHALYGQGSPQEFEGTPLSGGASLGVHESQSRFWENVVGRSLGFCKWVLPKYRKHFPGKFDALSPEDLYKAVNKSAPSFIRVEADEVTYNLHIMLRFEIETMLLERKLKVADAPEFWNARMKDYFGLTPKKASDGILQDIHWSMGSMGYFPTYTLGNLLSAQISEKISQELGGTEARIEKGDFKPILAWLRKNIHAHGRKYLPDELLKKAINDQLRVEPFLDYIRNKYSKIYGF
jgi:carboxypeptidase Taq